MNTIEQKIRRHEIDRVSKMSDRQLSTRYGKMSDKKKIEAFYSVLKDEKRNDVLQQRIAQDYPEFASVVVATVATEWVVFRENEDHGFNHEYITFTQPACFGAGVTPYLLVSKASPMRVHNETVQHSTQSARQLWAHLMKEGWRQEVL